MTPLIWFTVTVISTHLVLDFFNVGRTLAREWNRAT